MKPLVFFCVLFIFACSVSAVTLTDSTIVLTNASINLTGCTWDFFDLSWDDGGYWLSVEGLTVSGSPTITYEINKNFSDLIGAYSCASFPYPSFSQQKSSYAVERSILGSADALVIVASFFSIIALIVIMGMLVTLVALGKINWDQFFFMIIILFSTGVLIGIGILVISSLGSV